MPFPGSTSLLHSQLLYPCSSSIGEIKGWSVHSSSPLLLSPHSLLLLQCAPSTGCSSFRHTHLFWHCPPWAVAWIPAAAWSSSPDLGVPVAISHSFCFLLLSPSLHVIFPETLPALLMGSVVFCSQSTDLFLQWLLCCQNPATHAQCKQVSQKRGGDHHG